ncbi:MAG: immunoglobulin domain-containing protein, partial [Verrucomicrobiota bacterium]|nr:immunoglobulin domain-containing protein [Verrucomicrobiota bacterium]
GKLMLTGSEGKVTVRARTVGSPYYLETEVEQSFEVKQKGWIALEEMQGGTVELDPAQELYEPGTVVKLTPKPGDGYEFTGWSGELDGTTSPKSVTVNVPMSVGAKFNDVQGPVLTLVGPAPGTTSKGSFSLSGSVSDNGELSGANWSLNGKDQGKLALGSSGEFSVSGLKLGYGANAIEVKASDEAGNVGSGSVSVTWSPERTLKIGTVLERQEGQVVEIPIELESQGGVSSMTFVLKYDPVYLAEPKLVWSSEMLGVLNSVNTGVVGELKCAFSLGSKSVSSGARLVSKVAFRVRSIPEELDSELGLEVLEMADTDGDTFEGSTTAVGGVAKLQLRRVKGDNNGNDKLDVGDGTVMLRMLPDREAVREWDVGSNDLNENTRLDSGDVTRVLKTAVRLVVKTALQGTKPRLMVHPRSRVMGEGQTYVFRVQATGTQPIRYQWYKNGEVLGGQKSAVLVRSGLKASDSGVYWVEASNSEGKVRSGSARLTVRGGSVGGRSIAKMGGDAGEAAEGAVLSLKKKSGGKVKVGVNLTGLGSNSGGDSTNIGKMGGEYTFSGATDYRIAGVSGTTLELSYPKDVLKLVGEGSHRAGSMVPEKLKNTVYWNVLPDNDYATQDGRLVFGLSSAEQWADADGQLAQLEFEVLDAGKLAEAEIKLTEVELTPDG